MHCGIAAPYRSAGLVVLAGLIVLELEIVLPLLVLPLLLLRAWALRADLSCGNRWWRLGATSIVAGALVWTAFKWFILIACREQLFERLDAALRLCTSG